MKRLLILLLATVLLLSAIVGCASSQTSNGASEDRTPVSTTTAASWSGDKGAQTNQTGVSDTDRKIIRNASLALEVIDVIVAYDEILNYAKQYGGYEIHRSQTRSDGYFTISAQIKIKPEQLDAFIEFIGTKGELINTQISTDDITTDYYDANTRLKSMESSLETYYGFLKKAANIEESLAVQNQINQLTIEIESLKGRIKLWDSMLAESIVTLQLRQIDDPVKIKKEINWQTLTFADMGYLMQSGLTSVLNFLVSAIQWLAIAIVVTLPIWIGGLIALYLVLRNRKKHRLMRQQAASLAAKQAMDQATAEETKPDQPTGNQPPV